MNKSETDVEFDILLMASAIRDETDRTSILLLFFVFCKLLIVSVIINFFILDFLILSDASLLKTACVMKT